MELYYLIVFFIFGLIFGSFYNVVGYRLPNNMSLINPSSHCPKCNHKLGPFELIPVFSYLFQGGKCKNCKIKFPKHINKNAKTLIRHFLIIDINKRLGCTKKGIYEIIQNPFFEGFDWEGLLNRNMKAPFIPKVNHLYMGNFKKLENIYLEENSVAVPKEKDPFYNW